MARYIDAEALTDSMLEHYNELCEKYGDYDHYTTGYGDAIDAIENAPTADVAPKSEYEKLKAEAERYKRYYFRHDYDEMIAEVLDKLDRFINSNCIEIKDERGIKGYVTSGVHFAIAELKKKYTEEG